MSGQSIPEQLRKSLQQHIEDADLQQNDELTQLMSKLSDLSDKVAAAKAKALARRKAIR
ncbi:MAG: hypothetical protein HWE26_09875 [Alteromonadaceae bacterium]|nr:hypothetical protein [Alteromonadaceae bacterium]